MSAKEPKAYNRKGELTPYGLGCGFVQQKFFPTARLELYREGGVLHVRAFDTDNHAQLCWENVENLKEARELWRRLAKQLKKRER